MRNVISSIICLVATGAAMAQVSIIADKNSVTFTNTNIESVKSAIFEKLNSHGFVMEVHGTVLSASKNARGNINSTTFLILSSSFDGGRDSDIELTGLYNFSKTENGVKVIPSVIIKHSRFGQVQQRTETLFNSKLIKGLQSLEVK